MEADSSSASQELLRQFIRDETQSLLPTLRLYILRAGLVSESMAASEAVDLLSDVVVEALAHVNRFRPGGQPKAWLLGIAANLIKRRKVELAKRQQREPVVRDLYPYIEDAMTEDELFERLGAASVSDQPGEALEADEVVSSMLSQLSDDDERIIRLAVLHEMDGKTLARELSLTPGAARVRLHRALNRLRAFQAELRNERDE